MDDAILLVEIAPFIVVPNPWWSWGWDERGEVAHMGHTLPCGHEIKAMSHTSQAQLLRNYRRMEARHRGHPVNKGG